MNEKAKEIIKGLYEKTEKWNPRSAWEKGVRQTMFEMVDRLNEWNDTGYLKETDFVPGAFEMKMLDGAQNWTDFAESGCSLCYTQDIVERFCTPSEKRRYAEGKLYGLHDLDIMARGCRASFRNLETLLKEMV